MKNQFKKLMLFKLLILVIQLRKLNITQKLLKLKKKLDHNHEKCITKPEINNLTSGDFAARIA